jgi:hypothetical protein
VTKLSLTRLAVAVGGLTLSLTAGAGSRPQIPIWVRPSTQPALTTSS